MEFFRSEPDRRADPGSDPAAGPPGTDDTRPLGIGRWEHAAAPHDPTAPDPSPVDPGMPDPGMPDPAPHWAPPIWNPPAAGPTASWSPPGELQRPAPAPGFGAPGPYSPPTRWPGPPYPTSTGASAVGPAPGRRGPRVGLVVAVAAVTALLFGTLGGLLGGRLAGSTGVPILNPGPGPSVSTVPAPSPPRSLPAAPDRMNTVEVARAVLPSTVTIRAGNGDDAATGSGFVLDTRGRIMTNNHVVAPAVDGGELQVTFSDGRRTAATIVGRSPSYDLAVIKVAPGRGLVPLPLGDSDDVRVGETVVAVGSPLGLPGTVTEGIVSAKERPVVVGTGRDADAASAYISGLQTDAPINPGNSGGPLVDAGARVIGVNSAILTLGRSADSSGNIGLGFAIPINQAAEIGEQLIRTGRASYPVIGARVEVGGNGVGLRSVDPGGPAARAGLRADDLVTAIDGQRVYEVEDLLVSIRTHRPGQQVTLRYVRDGTPREARVTLGGKEG